MIGRQNFEPKHGTDARWTTCRCRECVEAGHAVGAVLPWTDRERLDAWLQTIPGAGSAAWRAIVNVGADLCGELQNGGDGTVDEMTWSHLRNIKDALKHLAFVLAAAERGDDPDIPF